GSGNSQPIWTNPNAAMTMTNNLVQCASRSGVLTADQMDDMGMMADSVNSQMQKMGPNPPQHRLRAMNTAMAAEVAEVVATSPPQSYSAVLNTIGACLRESMMQATGSVDNAFTNEVMQLVKMLSADSANEVST
uniref:Minor ampullate spidroin n=1 Tax=Araneus ventricosus TaxID=182803 RepID=UPI0006891D9D|nr:Chain A, Minor ampullate spidroin [Araneus ventricosus]2MX9_A Chain A, Minor ampullate spidroin [Araneus ventricosus]2MX9_B Chain B, Minor ampullate spidroin [Araneus ventricosus]